MKSLIFGSCLCMLLAQGTWGQNLLSIQHGYEAGELINPASIVKEEGRNHLYLLHNKQLSPFNQFQLNYARYSHKTKSDKVGFGGQVFQQQLGDLAMTSFMIDYNYQLLFANYNKLSFGLRFGVFQTTLNTADLNPFHNDDYLLNKGNQSNWNTNGTFGVRFTRKDFSTEFSIPQLFVAKRTQSSQNLLTLNALLFHRTLYTFHPEHIDLTIEPQYVFYKEKNHAIRHQLGVNLIYRDFIQLYSDICFQTSYKMGVGLRFKSGLYLGYNAQRYLIHTQTFKGVNQEIMLAYRFSRNKRKSSKEMLEEFYEPLTPDYIDKSAYSAEILDRDSMRFSSPTTQAKQNSIKQMDIPDFSARVSNRDQVIDFLRFRAILIEPFNAQKFEFNSFDKEKMEFVLVLGIFDNQKAAVKLMKSLNCRFVQTTLNQINKDFYVILPVQNDLSQRNLEEIWRLLEYRQCTYWMIRY